jgi:hypothetical protein
MSEKEPQAVNNDATRTNPPRRFRWKWPLIILALLIITPVLIFTIRIYAALHYTYSAGDRAGYVQKFSKKGWICKTWEGELAMVNVPGAMQERWVFSVRSDSVAALIRNSMGKQVSLSYEEHPGVPTSCFGDTQYFVVGIHKLAQP